MHKHCEAGCLDKKKVGFYARIAKEEYRGRRRKMNRISVNPGGINRNIKKVS